MQDILISLGRLLERSDHQTTKLDAIASKVSSMDTRLYRLESRRGFRMPPLEKFTKDLLALLLPAYTLWATGSLAKALEVIQQSAR